MLRPGWFPEYTPDQQKIFDSILETIQSTFRQHNYDHIYTPAVEKNEILLKWWEESTSQIFGLYWFAQWPSDLKDYSLHFDLTVPFARYVIDHRNILTFPYSRYQIQPVWRWERHQKWRFKEFWQCDIDTIYPNTSDLWARPATQTIYILQKALSSVISEFGISDKIKFTTHVSDLRLTKKRLNELWFDLEAINKITSLFDKFYKLTREQFEEKLSEIANPEQSQNIISLIYDQNIDHIYSLTESQTIQSTVIDLKNLGCNVIYDPTIIRWLAYYTWVVFETFISDNISLWSICSWWEYANFTEFIDNKNIYSWVWGSIWVSRLMDLLIEQIDQSTKYEDKYIFINFWEETRNDIVRLYQLYIWSGKTCEIYPTPAKLWKQFEYADKKNIRYAVMLWTGEKEQNKYKIKNLETWDETIIDL
jgi:histidyl-tRNA synthetase